MVRRPSYALSIKQPWAALLVAGQKTIEIRSWATSIRGRVFIHAARMADDRPEGWAKVNDEIQALAKQTGGVIGSAELVGCVRYRTLAGFTADADRHLNDPSWFDKPPLYGFTFRSAKVIPFVPCKGSVRFFTVTIEEHQ